MSENSEQIDNAIELVKAQREIESLRQQLAGVKSELECSRRTLRNTLEHQERMMIRRKEAAGVQLASTRTGRVYLAGPMTGIPDFNFPTFNAVAARFRQTGFHVENPADHGVVEGAEWADYLRYDIARLATCDELALLPGWENSKGARLEKSIAEALGMKVFYLDDWGNPRPEPYLDTEQPERTGVGSWCAPGPADKQVRRWVLRFEDAEVEGAIYDNEGEARAAFAKAEGRGWNCHLFAHAPRANDTEQQRREAFDAERWQPIETAPRDGTPILAYDPTWMDPEYRLRTACWVVRWDAAHQEWLEAAGEEYASMESATHWMPLPAAPAEGQG